MTYLHQSLIALGMVFLMTFAASGVDWSACQSDLDDVRRAASDAADAAEEVTSAAQELDDKRSELEDAAQDLRQCLTYPEIYDLLRDRCRSRRSTYESAKDDYESAKRNYESERSELASELDTLTSRFRSAQASCGIDGATPRFARPGGGMCQLLQSYKGRLDASTLMQLCRRSLTEEQCRACLQ